MSSVPSCLRFRNTRCLLEQWITFHTTVGMSRLLSAAAVAWSSSHVMSVIVCRLVALPRAKRAGSTSLLVLTRPANDDKPNGVLDRTPPSHQTESFLVKLQGSVPANSDLGFCRKLRLTILQRFCSGFVMVSTHSFDESCDIPNWTSSCFKAGDTTDRVNARLGECSWRPVKRATCFNAFTLCSFASETLADSSYRSQNREVTNGLRKA